ncbi:hypothetical protein [Streptomyces sp. BH105]|uniref:hypothetical protein n=1 Tax=Streptomyces sp. BH105 TaxID=3410408 RepID=UPI003CF65435
MFAMARARGLAASGARIGVDRTMGQPKPLALTAGAVFRLADGGSMDVTDTAWLLAEFRQCTGHLLDWVAVNSRFITASLGPSSRPHCRPGTRRFSAPSRSIRHLNGSSPLSIIEGAQTPRLGPVAGSALALEEGDSFVEFSTADHAESQLSAQLVHSVADALRSGSFCQAASLGARPTTRFALALCQ